MKLANYAIGWFLAVIIVISVIYWSHFAKMSITRQAGDTAVMAPTVVLPTAPSTTVAYPPPFMPPTPSQPTYTPDPNEPTRTPTPNPATVQPTSSEQPPTPISLAHRVDLMGGTPVPEEQIEYTIYPALSLTLPPFLPIASKIFQTV